MAVENSPSPIDTFIDKVEANILTPLVTLVSVLAFLLFVYGIVEFIRNAENEEKRATGAQHILWGLIGLVVIFGANAIIGFLKNTVGTN